MRLHPRSTADWDQGPADAHPPEGNHVFQDGVVHSYANATIVYAGRTLLPPEGPVTFTERRDLRGNARWRRYDRRHGGGFSRGSLFRGGFFGPDAAFTVRGVPRIADVTEAWEKMSRYLRACDIPARRIDRER